MTTMEKLNKISRELFQCDYIHLEKSEAYIVFKNYLNEQEN